MSSNGDNSIKLLQSWLSNNYYEPRGINNEDKLFFEAQNGYLNLFKQAVKRIPAYTDFLAKHKLNPDLIQSFADLKNIPATTKENYISKYSVNERCWDGKLNRMHIISTSSGTTGEPLFWPRDLQAEIEGAIQHEFIFNEVFKVKNKKVLFINGFAMGNWIAGTFTSNCVVLNNQKGYSITLMSPGYNEEALLQVIKSAYVFFDCVIVSGHIPFLKEVIDNGQKKGINWSKLNIMLLGTGQAITESWRENIIEKLDAKENFSSVINVYGSADAGLMGFETELSIRIRKIADKNRSNLRNIFHSNRLPSLYNYDPRFNYFEEISGELHLTKSSGCPLIKYNIHDQGGIMKYSDLISKNKVNDALQDWNWKLPFVYLYGRDKFMVKIYGANVYSEHVQHAMNHEKLLPLVTGRYLMEMDYDAENNPKLILRVELNKDVAKNNNITNLVKTTFIEVVKQINNEYKYVLDQLGDKVAPSVILHDNGDSEHFPKGVIKKNA